MWTVLELVDKVNGSHYDQSKDDKIVAAGETHNEHVRYSSHLARPRLKDWPGIESENKSSS